MANPPNRFSARENWFNWLWSHPLTLGAPTPAPTPSGDPSGNAGVQEDPGSQQGGIWSGFLQIFLPSGPGTGTLAEEAPLPLAEAAPVSPDNSVPENARQLAATTLAQTPAPVFTPVEGAGGIRNTADTVFFSPEETITPAGAGCVSVSGQVRPDLDPALNPVVRPVLENICAHTFCNGICTDTADDPSNCGSCGNTCQSPASCRNGICSIPPVDQPRTDRIVGQPVVNCARMGTTDCNGMCADLRTDMGNCGSCGRACPTGYLCENGECCTFLINPRTHDSARVCEE